MSEPIFELVVATELSCALVFAGFIWVSWLSNYSVRYSKSPAPHQ
jgi:hypothetical protein